MQRLKLLGLALIAVFAFSAMASAVASAETEEKPNALPVGVKFTVANVGEPELLTVTGVLKVLCKKLKGSGEMNAHLGMDGKVSLLFEECKATVGIVTGACTSLTAGVPAGDIHVLGAAVNLRYLLPSSEKKVHLLILIHESSEDHVHYTCVGLALYLESGCVASDDITTNELLSTLTVKFLVKKTGTEDEQQNSVDNLPATAMETCELSVMKGSEANERVYELAEWQLTTEAGKTILIMA